MTEIAQPFRCADDSWTTGSWAWRVDVCACITAGLVKVVVVYGHLDLCMYMAAGCPGFVSDCGRYAVVWGQELKLQLALEQSRILSARVDERGRDSPVGSNLFNLS